MAWFVWLAVNSVVEVLRILTLGRHLIRNISQWQSLDRYVGHQTWVCGQGGIHKFAMLCPEVRLMRAGEGCQPSEDLSRVGDGFASRLVHLSLICGDEEI